MRVINDFTGLSLSDTAVCLGNFDGLHLGHRLIISSLKEEAAKIGAKTVIFTFYPHPLKFFGEDIALLSTPRKRLELFENMEADYLINAPFDKKLASRSAENFFKDVIAGVLGARIVAVGNDYRFGTGKSGDIQLMGELGRKFGVKCVFVEKVKDGHGIDISSSRIRRLISEGNVKEAGGFLGRRYSVEGTVIRGDGMGRVFGFPTINMDVHSELIPASGVYASDTLIDGSIFRSMTYIGTRPTVRGKGGLRVETNIFGFDADVYGRFAEVFFKERIRGEMKFGAIGELKTQMASDMERAKNCA